MMTRDWMKIKRIQPGVSYIIAGINCNLPVGDPKGPYEIKKFP